LSTAAPTKPGDYAVARPRGVCAISNLPIEPGETFMAALRDAGETLERLDVKSEHWSEFDSSTAVAFWRCTMPRGQEKRKLLVDDAMLCELLVRLQDATEPAKLSFRFVLALILMRKRMVIYESTRREGDREVWTIRLRGREGSFDLIDAKPTEEQIAAVREQLGEILNEDA
jgi:hypothetical protein